MHYRYIVSVPAHTEDHDPAQGIAFGSVLKASPMGREFSVLQIPFLVFVHGVDEFGDKFWATHIELAKLLDEHVPKKWEATFLIWLTDENEVFPFDEITGKTFHKIL